MNMQLLVKVFTLLLFVGLLSAFVAYKSGVFSPTYEGGIKYSVSSQDTIPPDSVIVFGDSLSLEDIHISSSKSGRIFEPPQDTPKPNLTMPSSKVLILTDPKIEEEEDDGRIMIPSSKSGPIFNEEIKIQDKSSRDTNLERFIIPSSKSAPMFKEEFNISTPQKEEMNQAPSKEIVIPSSKSARIFEGDKDE